MNTDNIITAIATRCDELDLSFTELAKRAGVARKTLYNFMSRDNDIGLRKLERICDSLGLAIDLKPSRSRPTEAELQDIFREDDE